MLQLTDSSGVVHNCCSIAITVPLFNIPKFLLAAWSYADLKSEDSATPKNVSSWRYIILPKNWPDLSIRGFRN